jgi:hypothetical protein
MAHRTTSCTSWRRDVWLDVIESNSSVGSGPPKPAALNTALTAAAVADFNLLVKGDR